MAFQPQRNSACGQILRGVLGQPNPAHRDELAQRQASCQRKYLEPRAPQPGLARALLLVMPTTNRTSKRPLTSADYKAHAKYVDHLRKPRQVTRHDVDALLTRTYHGAAKMTRRAYLFDQEYILTMCLG